MSESYITFVLRGQPFTNAHLQLIRKGLNDADWVIVVLGSYRTPMTTKNPWDFNTRQQFIRGTLTKEENDRVIITYLRDFLYSDMTWVTSLQNTVAKQVRTGDKVSIIGHFKDDSSYYLNFFPQWTLMAQPAIYQDGVRIDATLIREMMFDGREGWKRLVPPYVEDKLTDFMKTEMFAQLKREHQYLLDYKKSWEKAPFPPTFITTDAVVVQAGHVLLIIRKVEPGKGRYALPGGFLNQGEFIRDCAVRELKEETKIDVPVAVLERCIKDQHCFDHPKRSLRGRSITHAFLFVLDGNKALPVVKGDDDAAEAIWMPINDITIHEENFFEDHIHIIQHFVNKL